MKRISDLEKEKRRLSPLPRSVAADGDGAVRRTAADASLSVPPLSASPLSGSGNGAAASGNGAAVSGERIAALREADAAFAARNGKDRAALAALGLSRSGYADYLRGVALAERERARYDARLSELAKNEETEGSLSVSERRTVLSALRSAGLTEESAVLRYCAALGIGEEEARRLASAASELGKTDNGVVQKTLGVCIRAGYYPTRAYAYAVGIGLSEAQAEKVREYTQKYWDNLKQN